jgi:hypothetical protein
MFLVHGLPGDPEREGDVGPRPFSSQGVLDGGILELVGELAKRHDRCELVGHGRERI